MGNWGLNHVKHLLYLIVLFALSQVCTSLSQQIGTIKPGFHASRMGFVDNNGLFLLSNKSRFAFGFQPTNSEANLFLLVILHQESSTVVWTANRASPVGNSDQIVFDTNGSVSLKRGGMSVWEPDTGEKPVFAVQLLDTGNLVFLGSDNNAKVWESFRYPTNTLFSKQDFVQGMQLLSDPSPRSNLTYMLEIRSGDMILSAEYRTPQVYWSMRKDVRKIINQDDGVIRSAMIESNSWKFYDQRKNLLWQFVFSSNSIGRNSTWIVVLRNDGFLAFYNLDNGPSKIPSSVRIPSDPCGTPEPCEAYFACSSSRCRCPSGLVSRGCNTSILAPCRNPNESFDLVDAGDGLSYFAMKFAQPFVKTNINGCQASCASNCTCLGLIFDRISGNCFLFDWLGSFISDPSSKYSVYVKVSKNRRVGEGNGGSNRKHLPIIVAIVISTLLVVVVMGYRGYIYYSKKKEVVRSPLDTSEDDSFFESLSGLPVRYSYKTLQEATDNFSLKLGQGGFGSVYQGQLADGTSLAVKKLEGVGQGKKEFRAEISIIGSVHHIHLVRLKGFCTEGSHRLLVYEYMANGSLDKWIFRRNDDNGCVLDWPTRFSIAVGTAKGLAYLHEDCEVKIVHCDIKPENVLLDEHFVAKVSDFGLAKLMTREQSHVFTTLRGTRGYLAPEWITNYAISEKSDVYSYGMVLLEIIGGRKNYDPSLPFDKSYFPAYTFKMMNEGKIEEILDSSLNCDPNNTSVRIAIKVALWCIQEDMSMRPPMTTVVQMLEGICPVPEPPLSTSTIAGFSQNTVTGCSSILSDVQLSGPR
ncbi:unnamed protein product [Amaranthus hypochondriacus]